MNRAWSSAGYPDSDTGNTVRSKNARVGPHLDRGRGQLAGRLKDGFAEATVSHENDIRVRFWSIFRDLQFFEKRACLLDCVELVA